MSCLLTCIWADAITEVLAIFDFAVPSDVGPTHGWWTALSIIALYSAFRLQMIRFMLWREERPFEYRFTNIVKCAVPGYELKVAFEELGWRQIVRYELFLLVVSFFYPLILLGEVIYLSRDNPNLRYLCANKCQIKHLKPLCQALKNCHSLKEVDLEWNNTPYSSNWIKEFCVVLEDNKTLRYCSISGNWETEEDQILVGEALASNKVIQRITVYGQWEREVHGFELQNGDLTRMRSNF